MKSPGRIWEEWYPAAIALSCGVVLYFYRARIAVIGPVFDQFSANALSISGTFAGFFLTILTIIDSVNTRRMRALRESGYYPALFGYLKQTIFVHLFLLIVCLFLPLIKMMVFLKPYSLELKILFITAVIFSWMISYRFTKIFISSMGGDK